VAALFLDSLYILSSQAGSCLAPQGELAHPKASLHGNGKVFPASQPVNQPTDRPTARGKRKRHFSGYNKLQLSVEKIEEEYGGGGARDMNEWSNFLPLELFAYAIFRLRTLSHKLYVWGR
jgi:hypothetical protein